MSVDDVKSEVPRTNDDDDEEDNLDSENIVHPLSMEPALRDLVICGSLCNTSTIHKTESGDWEANGDATEIALTVVSMLQRMPDSLPIVSFAVCAQTRAQSYAFVQRAKRLEEDWHDSESESTAWGSISHGNATFRSFC